MKHKNKTFWSVLWTAVVVIGIIQAVIIVFITDKFWFGF